MKSNSLKSMLRDMDLKKGCIFLDLWKTLIKLYRHQILFWLHGKRQHCQHSKGQFYWHQGNGIRRIGEQDGREITAV